MVAWQSVLAGESRMAFRILDAADGTQIGSIGISGSNQSNASIAALGGGGGGFVVAVGGSGEIRLTLYKDGYDPSAIANAFRPGAQTLPEVVALADGGFIVTWQSDDVRRPGNDIYDQLFDATDTPVGGEFAVNTAGEGHQSRPDVTQLADGSIAFVWQFVTRRGPSRWCGSRRFRP